MNYRCYQILLRGKHFYTNRERCEVVTGYLSLGRRPVSGWANMTLNKTFQNVLFKPEVAVAPVTSFPPPFRIPQGGLYQKYNILYCYTIIIILYSYINNNNAVINNNYGMLQGLILLINIPMGMQKNLCSLQTIWAHTRSTRFASCTPGGGKALGPMHWPPLHTPPSQEIPLLLMFETGCQPQCHSAARKIKSMNNLYDPIRN